MPIFSETSRVRLDTCDPQLVILMDECIKHFDFKVIEGHRTLEQQREHYANGKSQLDGVSKKSKHQSSPSRAVDVMPCPAVLHGVNVWTDMQRWALFIGRIRGHADRLGIKITCGIDWDGDGSMKNNKWIDAPHIELDD